MILTNGTTGTYTIVDTGLQNYHLEVPPRDHFDDVWVVAINFQGERMSSTLSDLIAGGYTFMGGDQ
jgi:hypothetical protein